MKRKALVILTVILVINLSLVVISDAATSAPITWVFATSSGASTNSFIFSPYPRFQKMVEKATGGRLVLVTKVDMFPATETIHAITGGRADIGMQRTPYVSGTFPVWDVGSLPFLFANYYEYENTVNDPKYLKIMEKTYGDIGLVKLAEPIGPSVDAIFAKKAIKTVDDFKGVKIRTAGMAPTLTVNLLGAAPLTTGMAEISQAVQRGTVDAVQTGAGFGLGLGLAGITTYVNFWPIQSVFPSCLAVNKKKWDALPEDLKKIVLNVSKQMEGQTFFGASVEYAHTRIAVESIMKVVVPDKSEIDKARTMVKPVINEWLKIAGPYGPEILEVVKKYASGAEIMLSK